MRFVQDILQALQDKELVSIDIVANVWEICPNLIGVLKRLCQELKKSDIDFSSYGDMSPVDVAKWWTAQLRTTQLCLHRACQNASVPIEAQRTITEFTIMETASLFLTYSHIIYSLMKLGDISDWWKLLCNMP